MNPHKRPAETPLSPLHSAKQRRTRMVDSDGGSSSASEKPGLLSRWKHFGEQFSRQFSALASDTFKAVAYPIRPATTYDSGSPSPSPRPQLYPTPSTRVGDYRSEEQASKNLHLDPQRTPAAFSNPTTGSRRLRPSSSTNYVTGQPNGLGTSFVSETHLSNDVSSFGRNTISVNGGSPPKYSRKNVTKISSKNDVSGVIPRNYTNRKHIFEKAHKNNVRAEHQKHKKEELERLYRIKRSSGYNSNFTDFQSLLAYQAKLERLDPRDAISPSSSMIDLYAKDRESSPRRHSYSDTDDTYFLQRILDRAKATLNEPRPPRPFQPTLEQLRLSQRLKDEGIEQLLRPKPVPPTPLLPKDDAQVDIILKKRGVISKYAREQVSDIDLSRLRPGQWLNDEIINFYGALLLGRSDDCKENPPTQKTNKMQVLNIYYFSTFFWPKLKEGYEKGRLAKWTKKVDIFSKDVILIPVNHSNAHWTSSAINFRKKRIESYDSMGVRRDGVFKALRAYLDAEHRNKKKTPFDFTGWQDYSIENPQQENGYDCGVFTCQFLQGLSRGDDVIRFTQQDMPALRRRMIWEIGNAKLRDEP